MDSEINLIMKWNSEIHATGFEEIDRQHKFLFDFSESYREDLEHGAGFNTYQGALEILSVYAQTHFGFEEKCVHSADCPFAKQNETEHAAFVTMLETEKIDFDNDGFVYERAIKLMDQLNSWLDNHIRQVDMKLDFK